MLNVCYFCAQYRADKEIDPERSEAICPECGHRHRFQYHPLFVVCGPAGGGKTTICKHLTGTFTDAVLLDGDILWAEAFNTPEDSYRGFFDTWLRMAKNIGQSGRPVVLFNSGAIPDNVVDCVEARYFSSINFLALVCNDGDLKDRLLARPEWRGCQEEGFIKEQTRFNNWLKENAQKDGRDITLVDSSHYSESETKDQVIEWILAGLN